MCNLVISSDVCEAPVHVTKNKPHCASEALCQGTPVPPLGSIVLFCILFSLLLMLINRHVAGLHLISAPTLTPLLWPNKYNVWIRPSNSSQPLPQKLQSTVIIVDMTTADALMWLFKVNSVHSFSGENAFQLFGSALKRFWRKEGGTTDRLIPVRRPLGLINGSTLGLGSVSVWEAEGCLFSRCWCLSSNCTYAELKFFSTKFSTAPLRSQVSSSLLHSSVSAALCIFVTVWSMCGTDVVSSSTGAPAGITLLSQL